MPTARSWTDAPARHVTEARRAVADVGHLLRFRAGSVRRPLALALGLTLFTVLTLSAAVVPGLLPGAGSDDGRARDVLVLLPTSFAAVVVIALVSAVASGGGRELIARDPAAVHPVSPTTDHLGALLLAPLNVAWLLQAWGLLGATAFAVGWPRLAAAQVGVVLWLALATAVAQVVAWALEGVRRSWHGDAALRVATAACLASAIALQLADELVPLLDRLPTLEVVLRIAFGFSWDWAVAVAALLVALLAAVALGAVPAHVVARRVPREEVRAESGVRRWRPAPRSDVTALLRVDRASVWRAVPIRRGIAVLAIGPGVVALLGGLPWAQLAVLPGLVASGGALLFGVNVWSLDGRGGRWRESLPVAPGRVFDVRAWVLAELLLAAAVGTLAVGGLRSGVPSRVELVAVLCVLVVVVLQVVGAAMRWSLARPYAVDLRSARATPAPPLTMVGYSTRLALSTTFTALLFSVLAGGAPPLLTLLAATACCCWSGFRLARTRRRWCDPDARARVVMTAAA